MTTPDLERAADILRNAPVVYDGAAEPSPPQDEPPIPSDPDGDDDDAGPDAMPSDTHDEPAEPAVVARCAGLDHSDTDNATRLIAHFGQDLTVLKTEGERSSSFIVFDGTHWDMASGNDAAIRVAQKIGGRIALEADHMAFTPQEFELLKLAKSLRERDPKTLTADEKDTIAEAEKVKDALKGRRLSRRKFGVTSKNKGRLEAMLSCAAPHLLRDPDRFNADPHLVAVQNCTLRFVVHDVPDPECPDPDAVRLVKRAAVDPIEGHRREHFITKLVPVRYDPEATCPRWDAFVTEFLPNANVRRCVQMFAGLGLTGIALQKIMFHYGNGANGKSVFLETLIQMLGPLAVGLPPGSLVGENQASGQQASPDIARLYGARCVRAAELPAGEKLKESLVKTLSGGERMPVRNLFKGFFEFVPVFKGHMSGNDYPHIDGTDNGIWRRMTVIHWPVTLADERQRELREVVAEFMTEAPGILNWLIAGVLDFLEHGFVVPPEVRAATKEYRDEMDPIGEFCADCVETCSGVQVQARDMYQAYHAWCEANAKRPIGETKFGRVMKTKFTRDDSGARHRYMDCRLHDVPLRETPARNPVD